MGAAEDPFARFLRKFIVDDDGCWIWTDSLSGNGYPQFNVNGKIIRPYRWYYELLNGPVPSGSELDHICNWPPCVNPDHLILVTHAGNLGVGWKYRRGYHYLVAKYGSRNVREHKSEMWRRSDWIRK